MLDMRMANTIVLTQGELVVANETDRAAVNKIKGFGLNLAALLRETLYQLQDGITVELHANEGHRFWASIR